MGHPKKLSRTLIQPIRSPSPTHAALSRKPPHRSDRHEKNTEKSARRNHCGSAGVVCAAAYVYRFVCGIAAVCPGYVPKAETLRETAYQLCAGLYPIPKTQGEAQQQGNGWQPVAGKENMTFQFKSGEARVFSYPGSNWMA